MLAILSFLLGGAVFTGGLLFWQRIVRHDNARLDEQKYKTLWTEAVELLAFNGQLSEEQIAKIMPPAAVVAPKSKALPKGKGFSSDRRDIEIARAEQGLPPADNLQGMFSSDVRKVHQARIKHGTAQ